MQFPKGACLWLAITLLVSLTLAAQPARTFAASTGSDLNPCSLAAPCRSLQAAFNAVATGGEVIALDSAGYGVVTVNRSAALEAPAGVYADHGGIGANGVTISTANATDYVILRGLTFNGSGVASFAVDFSGVEICTWNRAPSRDLTKGCSRGRDHRQAAFSSRTPQFATASYLVSRPAWHAVYRSTAVESRTARMVPGRSPPESAQSFTTRFSTRIRMLSKSYPASRGQRTSSKSCDRAQ